MVAPVRGGRYLRRSLVVLLRSVRTSMRTRLMITSVVAQGLLLGGCAEQFEQCHRRRGIGRVRCVRPVGLPRQPGRPATPVAITFDMFDAINPVTTAGPTGGSDLTVISFDPLPGVSIEACNSGDVLCSTPVTPVETTEDAGVATLTVPGNFDGFFKLTAAPATSPRTSIRGTSSPTHRPSRRRPRCSPPRTRSTSPVRSARSWTSTLARAWGSCSSRSTIASIGTARSSNSPLSVDAGATTVPFYLADGLPSRTATETDSIGAAGVVNAPIGTMTITATLAATNQTLGSFTVDIRAGGTTSGWVRVRSH